ncbi:tannase/feruloyl esterase family alpha/beta hydrolase [Ramlibacter sp. WS9]|uniref:tannase/feruloyl esterase family alpha/beta hydrolase n=1 Tax=Ramlibacter sp. WS9 TaxID=1882741 RepID=UPI001142409F|nr:tannase/feruloyl esterase family alpha/beta hydrolase [Ramlibacter sp. WS9]ROZ74374.1 tannase/feruloyl esterase family alpha/beta hydrolase [Ramlibacter sp. WS9]
MTNFSSRALPRAGLALLALSLSACTTIPNADRLATSCASLTRHVIAPGAIGLPSGKASVTSAVLTTASAATVNNGTYVPALPQFCKVNGTIASRDPAAQAINFQLNLPISWNGKALQYGGGGFNGVLITGLTPLRDAAPDDPLPIARGYATFGQDSGHQAAAFPPGEPGAFALNEEMLENFAFASYKKVKDVAVDIMRTYYERQPQRMYYFGISEGGREGLTMAQRFPADYDGIVSIVPVINWTGLFHAFIRNQIPQHDDWLQAGKASLIAKATSDTCDALDGLADGVVNNYMGCQTRVDLQPLRCPGGRDAGLHCLSDAELRLLRDIHSPYVFPFPIANGLTTYPQWLYGHEDSLDGPSAVSLVRWVSGAAAPATPPDASRNSTQWIYGSNWIRYAIARDKDYDVRRYRPENFRAQVQKTSALMDSTNPDLSAFFARGGKLILRENAADRAQSPLMGIQYHDALVARLGAAAVERSVRLYVSPGSTHTGNSRAVAAGPEVPTMVDLLDPLDRWVNSGAAPASALVQVIKGPLPPFAVQATRPMCRYPAYPHYVRGDRMQASSYECRHF